MQEFLARISGQKEVFQPKLKCFRNITFAEGRSILVRGSSGSGLTAVTLDICKEYLDRDWSVIYFDHSRDLHFYRIPDLLEKNFYVAKTSGSSETVQLLSQISTNLDKEHKLVICLDGSYLLSQDDDWFFQCNLDLLRKIVTELFVNATIIVTERSTKHVVRNGWSDVIIIEQNKLFAVDREPVGHLIDINHSLGSTEAFVDYNIGRLSGVYDFYHYTLERRKGTYDFNKHKLNGIKTALQNVDPIERIK